MTSTATLARALTLQNEGRVAEAVAMYRELLAREPLDGDALHLLGVAVARLGQTQEAVRLIGAAVQLQPSNAAARTDLANALSANGSHAEALPCYDRALALQPDLARAYRGRGAALLALGQPEAAQASFREALRLAPGDDQALNALGVALERLSRPDEARQCFSRAITLNPANVDAHHNLSLIEAAADRHAQALMHIERALALQPLHPALHANRGNELLALGRPAEAVASFDRAIGGSLAPQQFDVHFQRGVALALLERHHESLASFSTAVILNPDSAEAVGNRGAVLVRLFRPAEALPDFARAVVLKPDYADAFLNAGIARRGLGRYREALDDLDRALSIRPEDPTAAWMKALLHLALGEFREGWPLYESRAQLPHARQLQRTLPGTRWTGTEPLAGRTLLVYADQGLGDTLQFCRYIPMLEALGANVVFEVQPVLKPLLGSLAMRGTLIGRGEALPEFDLHIPLLSVPLAVRTELDCIPGGVPYLRVHPAAIRWWGERLAALPGLKVGLNWCGNPEAEKVAALEARSFPLTAAAALAGVRDVSLVSLQKGAGAAQLAEAAFGSQLMQLVDPHHMGAEELAAETAAIIMGLDVVITCDTALAHLAGALGARVWVVLQAVPDWRWLIGREDSPWYPTMRLFRQRVAGDWPELFERVAAALADWRDARAN
ncbi:MAG: tetratricopeptide repeat protein, partial [Gammaproteobacteria bacterium]